MKLTKIQKFAWFLIIIGGLSLLISAYLFLKDNFGLLKPINPNLFDNYGSFVGGVSGALFSLASFLLIVETIREAQKDRLIQEKQQIESRFFEMLKFHREHVTNMVIHDNKGEKTFDYLIGEFYYCYELIKKAITIEDNDSEPILINIAYLCFFLGTENENNFSLDFLLEKAYPQKKYYPKIRAYIEKIGRQDKTEYLEQKNRKLKETLKFPTIKNFLLKEEEEEENHNYAQFDYHVSGRREILGHYYRHLIHLVRFVNSQNLLNYTEKYDLIKTLRAQMSDQEQTLLFFNSLSMLGSPWEFEHSDPNLRLITKYNLIKNVSTDWTNGIDLKKYFPDLSFHSDEDSKGKKELILKFYN